MKGVCGNCRWWGGGNCHRYPPKMAVLPANPRSRTPYSLSVQFPWVSDTDWCGEFSPKTGKPEEF